VFLIGVGAAVGTLLAVLRGRVLLVMLASAALAITMTLLCLLLGYHLGPSALVGFGSIAAVQASYLTLGLTLNLFSSVEFNEVQGAIAQQLRTEFEVPNDQPPKLARLVLLLEAA
jgi:hypothetical protein